MRLRRRKGASAPTPKGSAAATDAAPVEEMATLRLAADQGPVDTLTAAPAAPTAAQKWYRDEGVAAAVGRHLTAPRDVDNFEQALGRPVMGLYTQLYDGALHRLLQPEIEKLRVYNAMYGPMRGSQVPNWPDRQLLRSFLSPSHHVGEILAEGDDIGRLFALDQALDTDAWRELPIAKQVREELDTRITSFAYAGRFMLSELRPLLAGERGTPFTKEALAQGETLVEKFCARYSVHRRAYPTLSARLQDCHNLLLMASSGPLADSHRHRYDMIRAADYVEKQLTTILRNLQWGDRPVLPAEDKR